MLAKTLLSCSVRVCSCTIFHVTKMLVRFFFLEIIWQVQNTGHRSLFYQYTSTKTILNIH